MNRDTRTFIWGFVLMVSGAIVGEHIWHNITEGLASGFWVWLRLCLCASALLSGVKKIVNTTD